MKRLRSFQPWLMAMVIFLFSCGSNESKTETATSDTSSTTPAESAPASTITTTPLNMMVVTHKVKDYDSWQTNYDAHDSMRLANGIHNYIIGRSAKDPNMVLVSVKVDDLAKAKAFSKDPGLKQAMQKGGVTGSPNFKFYTLTFRDTGKINTELRTYTTVNVKDWNAWQKSFDSTRQIPTDNGLVVRAYGHETDNDRKVVIVSAITDTAKANAFWKSDLLKQRRAASGASDPVRFVYNTVKRY